MNAVPNTHWGRRDGLLHDGVDPDECDLCACPTCHGAGVIDTSPDAVFFAPWLQSDTPCPDCRPEVIP